MSFWKNLTARNKHTIIDVAVGILCVAILIVVQASSELNPLVRDILFGSACLGLVGYLGYILFYRKKFCGGCMLFFLWSIVVLCILAYEFVTGISIIR